MRKYWYRRFLLVLLVLSVLGYAGYEITKRQEQGRKKEVSADTVSSDTVMHQTAHRGETAKAHRG